MPRSDRWSTVLKVSHPIQSICSERFLRYSFAFINNILHSQHCFPLFTSPLCTSPDEENIPHSTTLLTCGLFELRVVFVVWQHSYPWANTPTDEPITDDHATSFVVSDSELLRGSRNEFVWYRRSWRSRQVHGRMDHWRPAQYWFVVPGHQALYRHAQQQEIPQGQSHRSSW